MARVRYSIVIPAYNEEHRISATLEHVLQYLGERNLRGEVIVVDDGSTDRTADVVFWYRRKTYKVKLLRLEHQGKGSAVRHGVANAHGEIVFLCDADMNAGFEECEKLETALLRGADVAIGSRWIGNQECLQTQPWYRRVAGRVFNLLTQRLLGLGFRDTQCGLKAFTRDAAKELFAYQTIDGWGFDPELLFLARRLGFRVEEVSIRLVHDYRMSRFRPILDGSQTFWELFQIFWRDLRGSYPRPLPASVHAASEVLVGESSTREAA
jgi:glycosyltransferase involved in cell wall biosynthesis